MKKHTKVLFIAIVCILLISPAFAADLLTAKAKAPVAKFSPQYSMVPYPWHVKFTDLSKNNPASYKWDFGDGTTSTKGDPAHTYKQSGVYYVTLTVRNKAGSSSMTGFVYTIPAV